MQQLRRAAAWVAVHVMMLAVPVSAALGRAHAAAPACPGDAVVPHDARSRGAAAGAVLCLVNGEREAHGLRLLKRSRMLTRAARSHSRDMVRRRYFAHVSPSGVDLHKRVARTGYLHGGPRVELGEAIAFGADAFATPRELVGDVMASAPHRAIILTPSFRDLGVGLALGAPLEVAGSASATLSLTFGRR
jgi:uncharacterized protein YkwD